MIVELKVEGENFDPDSGERRELYCYAISAKRYALYNLDQGQPVMRKASRHGLGHLLNPADPNKRDDTWVDAVVKRDLVVGTPGCLDDLKKRLDTVMAPLSDAAAANASEPGAGPPSTTTIASVA